MTEASPDPQTDKQKLADAHEIVARPSTRHRIKLGIVALVFLGAGAWFVIDGFFRWPEENRIALGLKQNQPHSDLDVQLQRVLAVLFVVVGGGLVVRVCMKSRGEYRLTGSVLQVSGHPPIDFETVTSLKIDKRRWKHKGIAVIDYELPDGTKGSFTLDDFYFDRVPTDAIFDRIEAIVKGEQTTSPAQA